MATLKGCSYFKGELLWSGYFRGVWLYLFFHFWGVDAFRRLSSGLQEP